MFQSNIHVNQHEDEQFLEQVTSFYISCKETNKFTIYLDNISYSASVIDEKEIELFTQADIDIANTNGKGETHKEKQAGRSEKWQHWKSKIQKN